MSYGLNNNATIASPKAWDDRTGKFSAGAWIPFVSTTEANTAVSSARRYVGLTVLIGTPSAFSEYWYAAGITDGDLVVKTITGSNGTNGWAPVLAVISDSNRRVLQVVDWVGGSGSKPTINQYVGATGLTGVLGSAVDIRGATGASGAALSDSDFDATGPVVLSISGGLIRADFNWDFTVTNPEDIPDVPEALVTRFYLDPIIADFESRIAALEAGGGGGGGTPTDHVVAFNGVTESSPGVWPIPEGSVSGTSVVDIAHVVPVNTDVIFYAKMPTTNDELVFIGLDTSSTNNRVFSGGGLSQWKFAVLGTLNNVSYAELGAAGTGTTQVFPYNANSLYAIRVRDTFTTAVVEAVFSTDGGSTWTVAHTFTTIYTGAALYAKADAVSSSKNVVDPILHY